MMTSGSIGALASSLMGRKELTRSELSQVATQTLSQITCALTN
jgi:hypothetical protein